MRALGRTLLGLLAVAGWFLLLLALLLWTGEETGILGRVVRDAVAARMGTLGDDLSLTGVRILWFDRALEVDRVELGADGEMALLRDVRVEFGLAHGGLSPRRVEVRGGHLRLSAALANSLQRYSEESGDRRALADRTELPTIQIEDLGVEWMTRRWGLVPIARLDLLARSNARGRPEIFGRAVPSLTQRTGEPGEVFLSGTIDEDGALSLRANATRMPLGTDGLPADEDLAGLHALQPRGMLELEAFGELPLEGGAPRVHVRLAVQRGALSLGGGRHRIEGLRLDVEGHWAPERLEGWRDPRTWHALGRASGTWNGAAFEATGLLGEEAGTDGLLEVWAHCAALPLERSLIAAVDAGPIAERVWEGLDPRGSTEIWAGGRVARAKDDADLASRMEFFALLHPAGAAEITYRGMVRNAAGELDEGFPLPLGNVTGEIACAVATARSRPWRVALVDLVGSSGPTTVRALGVVAAHPREVPAHLPGVGMAEIDLDLVGDRLPVDDRLRAALQGLGGALPPDGTWRPFRPDGGELGVRLRLYRRPELAWLATDLDLEMRGLALAWDDLPLPVNGAGGRLRFRSDGRSRGGLSVDVTGSLRTAQRAGLALRLATQGSPPLAPEPPYELGAVSYIRATVDRLSLTGDDRRILIDRFPEIGKALEELSPKGFADVRYERTRHGAGAPFESSAEVTPMAPAQLVPRRFPMTVGDLRGRVLLRGTEDAGGTSTDVRVAPLVGTLGEGVDVALTARMPDGAIEVAAAGVDPANRSFLGALGDLVQGAAAGGAALSGTALSLAGRIDIVGNIPLDGAAGAGRWRTFLRRSQLATATGFRLSDVRGDVEFADGVLSGRGLTARLASTRVDLADVRFAPEAGGWRLDANFEARDVPIDREHLLGFADERTLDALLGELAWQGRFDFQAGRLGIVISPRGEPRLELAGSLAPREMSIRLGLPLEVEHATARLERLVYESGKVRALLAVENFTGRLAGRRLENGRMLVTYVEPSLSIEGLQGTLEGGRILALGAGAQRVGTAFSIALADPFPFELGLDLRAVEVAGMLRGLFPSGLATQGELDGELQLAGDLEHLLGIEGSGWLRMRQSRLWSVPVFRALFAQLGLDDTATFDSMYTNLRVRDGIVKMDDIVLRSPLLQLVGEGSLDFNGRMRHDLEVRYALLDRLGPLTRLLYWIQNELLTVRIRGDMGRPEVVLQNPLRRMFSGGESFRALPVPGYAPLPERF